MSKSFYLSVGIASIWQVMSVICKKSANFCLTTCTSLTDLPNVCDPMLQCHLVVVIIIKTEADADYVGRPNNQLVVNCDRALSTCMKVFG